MTGPEWIKHCRETRRGLGRINFSKTRCTDRMIFMLSLDTAAGGDNFNGDFLYGINGKSYEILFQYV